MNRKAGKITALILLALLLLWMLLEWERGSVRVARIEFLGGAREVGGSCIRIVSAGGAFLVDCGALGEAGDGNLPEKADSIGFVLLTHAHSDHCGLLPELFERGFRGSVYCTPATAEIVPVLLRMSRGFSKDKASREAFDAALGSLRPVPFDSLLIVERTAFRFGRAGHILGAAYIEAWLGDEGKRIKIVFSGDIGSGSSLLTPPPEPCPAADYVVIESTYGGVTRSGGSGDWDGIHAGFAAAVSDALARGGDVLIPAFTLGRTQEVIAALDYYTESGVIPKGTEIFCDSPTANRITEIHRRHREDLSSWARDFYGDRTLKSSALREVKSRTSVKVHDRTHSPAIFVSSSGDLEHANAPRHLARMFGDERNLLCIVGWQSPGSLGERLVGGETPVLIRYREGKDFRREWISPSLEIGRFSSFSGHADQEGLIEWIRTGSGAKKVFIVHGEAGSAKALEDRIRGELGLETAVPLQGESFDLEAVDGGAARSGYLAVLSGRGSP